MLPGDPPLAVHDVSDLGTETTNRRYLHTKVSKARTKSPNVNISIKASCTVMAVPPSKK